MQLAYTDGREIAELQDFQTGGRPIGTAPIEYTASISSEGASLLRKESAPFYRGRQGEERFTLTIDGVRDRLLSGTVRRR
jgi:hypothetical protein